jgi:hypothetical protein
MPRVRRNSTSRLWYVQQSLQARDARIWIEQELVQIALSCLGVLAGVNQVYFSPLQLKRTRRFADELRVAPADLADRLDALFEMTPSDANTYRLSTISRHASSRRTLLLPRWLGLMHVLDRRAAADP